MCVGCMYVCSIVQNTTHSYQTSEQQIMPEKKERGEKAIVRRPRGTEICQNVRETETANKREEKKPI